MSSTILVGKHAECMVARDGTVLYLLHEKTYDSNVHPQDPSWCAIAFGTFAEVMLRICRHAASVEGGSFRNRARNMRPETYIADWRKRLAKPSPMRSRDFAIDHKRLRSSDAEYPAEKWCDLKAKLVAGGYEDDISSEMLTEIRLDRHHALLRELLQFKRAWDFFSSLPDYEDKAEPMSAPPKLPVATGVTQLPKVAVYGIDLDNRIVSFDGGKNWSSPEWAYSLVGSYIRDVLYAAEMIEPGISKTAIPAFREALKKPLTLPDRALWTVWPMREGEEEKGTVRYHREKTLKLLDALGYSADKADGTLTLFWAQLRAVQSVVYKATNFDPKFTSWSIPAVELDPPTQATFALEAPC